MARSRFDIGMELFQKIDAGVAGKFVDNLADISPDLARLTVEFAFGDVLSRDVLDLKMRELVTIGMLGVMGTAEPQLELHMRGAIKAGATKEEIVEIVLQIAVYAGFPAAMNAVRTAKNVFKTVDNDNPDKFWS